MCQMLMDTLYQISPNSCTVESVVLVTFDQLFHFSERKVLNPFWISFSKSAILNFAIFKSLINMRKD